ncbi:MAG: hypothetical protein HN531_03575 [Opitutae bacterium]|nr:hypothetical protein [Opitutae bacterium]
MKDFIDVPKELRILIVVITGEHDDPVKVFRQSFDGIKIGRGKWLGLGYDLFFLKSSAACDEEKGEKNKGY